MLDPVDEIRALIDEGAPDVLSKIADVLGFAQQAAQEPQPVAILINPTQQNVLLAAADALDYLGAPLNANDIRMILAAAPAKPRKTVAQLVDETLAANGGNPPPDAWACGAEQQAPATEQAPPLPKPYPVMVIVDEYGSGSEVHTADQLRERDAMWMAKIAALRSEQAPLEKPCACGKQSIAWCLANSCHKAEQAPAGEVPSEREQFEKWIGPNLARKLPDNPEHYTMEGINSQWKAWQARAALSTPPAVPQIPEGWMRDREQVEKLAEHLESMGWAQTRSGDMECVDQGSAMAAEVVRTVLLPALSAAPAAPGGEQPK